MLVTDVGTMLDKLYLSDAEYKFLRSKEGKQAIPFQMRARLINEYRRYSRRAM